MTSLNPASNRRDHLAALAAAAAVTFIVVVLWLRTGLVPAASGGDEVWWSESGYHFLREGVLRWGCLADDRGSGQVSYWPPIAPLLQAALMKAFGVTAFGITAQSALVGTLAMGVIFLLVRRLGCSAVSGGFAAVATFGLFMVERRLTQVRMENLTALSALTFAWLMLEAAARPRRAAIGWLLSAGAVAMLGLLSYYPQSPFLACACLLGAWRLMAGRRLETCGWVSLGAAPIAVVAAIWIGSHWDLFRAQVLGAGSSYWSWANVTAPLVRLAQPFNADDWIQQIEKWLVLVGAIAVIGSRGRGPHQMLGAMAVILSLPMFFYASSPQVAAGLVAIPLLFSVATSTTAPRRRRILMAAAAGLVLAAVTKVALLGTTAVLQRESRDYERVAAELRSLVAPEATVAISQRAWLGLREQVASDRLHLLTYSGPSIDNRPVVTRTDSAAEYFTTLVLEKQTIGALREVYPWLARALDAGTYELVREISPPFRALPWSRTPSYELRVYERRLPGAVQRAEVPGQTSS